MCSHWNLRCALACRSSGESFFLRIYCSFSLSKESKSYCDPQWQCSTASTSFHQKVKKVQIASLLFATLESITREQDVITSLMTYYISHALPSHWMTGGIFRSKAALRNRALTENKCLIHFWKGLAVWYPLCTAESALKLGKRRRRVFSFSCNVMFESNLCFMLLWCLRKERHCMR